MMFVKSESITFRAVLINLMGIPSGPVAFHGFNILITSFMSPTVAFGESKIKFSC